MNACIIYTHLYHLIYTIYTILYLAFELKRSRYQNPDGTWSIAQTQSPDEYHTNITDGVFPNMVARQSLLGTENANFLRQCLVQIF